MVLNVFILMYNKSLLNYVDTQLEEHFIDEINGLLFKQTKP